MNDRVWWKAAFEILAWAAVLPWVGYWLLCIRLIGLPLIGLFAPLKLVVLVYWAGFLPSLVPAAAFALLRRRGHPWWGFLAAAPLSALAAWAWWGLVLLGNRFSKGGGEPTITVIAALATLIFLIPLIPRGPAPVPPMEKRSFLARIEDRVFGALLGER